MNSLQTLFLTDFICYPLKKFFYAIDLGMSATNKYITGTLNPLFLETAVEVANRLAPIKHSPNKKYSHEYFFRCLIEFTQTSVSWSRYKAPGVDGVSGKYLNSIHQKYVKTGVYEEINKQLLGLYITTGKEEKLKFQVIDSKFVQNQQGSVKSEANNSLLSTKVKETNKIILKIQTKLKTKQTTKKNMQQKNNTKIKTNEKIIKETKKSSNAHRLRLKTPISSLNANLLKKINDEVTHILRKNQIKIDALRSKNKKLRKINELLKKNLLRVESFIDYNSYNGRKKYFKISTICNSFGVPFVSVLISSRQSDNISLEQTVERIPLDLNTLRNSKVNRYRQYLIADSGYDSKSNHKYLEKIGYLPIIANNRRTLEKRKNMSPKEKIFYKKRKIIESMFSWLKNFPVLNQNYQKTLSSFNGLLQLCASIIVAQNI